MWRKLLKLRGLAQGFLKVEVRNGENTSFWYDVWSRFGVLKTILGNRGLIDLGIGDNATMAEALANHRQRRHRLNILNEVEDEITKLQLSVTQEEDIHLWKQTDDKYATKFSSKKTWEQIRGNRQSCSWSRGVWFPYSTPKYAFFHWVIMRDRLQTADKMQSWNLAINTTCVLCNEEQESCSHLFFGCQFSGRIWRKLVGGLMLGNYTADWNVLKVLAANPGLNSTKTFIFRYVLQATLHTVWRERNARRHGEQPNDVNCLVRFVDKTMRLMLLSVKEKGHKYLEEGLITWFGTQETNGEVG